MYRKEINYTDYNGEKQTDVAYFNLDKAELLKMLYESDGNLPNIVEQINEAKQVSKIAELFEKWILRAYGVKSPDGKCFLKEDEEGRPLSRKFKQSAAYAQLYMEYATNADAAAEFINNIIPKDLEKEVNAILAKRKAEGAGEGSETKDENAEKLIEMSKN